MSASHLSSKASRGDFLRRNPFPRPLLDGFFYREKMRAIHRVTPDDAVGTVLEIGGALLVSTPNENRRFPHFAPLRRICPTEAEIMAEWGHVRRGYRLAELERIRRAVRS